MTHQHAASNSGNTSIAHNHTIPVISGNADSSGAHEHNTNLHSHTTNNHSHGLNVPGTSGDTNINHTHTWSDTSAGANAQTTSAGYSYSWTSPSPTVYRYHTHTVSGTTASTNLNHTHSVGGNVDSVANLNTNNAQPTAVSGGAHTHTVSNIASATADGAGGSHTHTTPVSDALSNLQPYMALNYIIKF